MEAEAKRHEELIIGSSSKEALDHAIAAAELYMKAASEAPLPADKRRLNKMCKELILFAERLKNSSQNVAEFERKRKLPQQVHQLSTSEKTLLYRNSLLHGSKFPPWESDPEPANFQGAPFSDPSPLTLSEKQETVFAGWKRPTEIIAAATELQQDLVEGYLDTSDDFDLVQDITTDCSVVASLCAGIQHLRPGPNSILQGLMFPADHLNGQPKISTSGRYIFRMFFNGCFRKVTIDDRLPASTSDRTLFVVDRLNPNVIWPALVEKAYLKIRGGYDFPGSNSGTDLFALTGWIPEQLFLRGDELDLRATWARVKNAYDSGNVVITLGTRSMSDEEQEALGLAGEHDYAVLNMFEDTLGRRMLVKNPWCDGVVWKGLGSFSSNAGPQFNAAELKPGCFWIDFDDVTQNFESLYLNWNPSLFTQRQDHHFTWRLPEPTLIGSFAHHPQYSVTAENDDETWILLSRHFQDAELELVRGRGSNMTAVSRRLGFTSIYVFENSGKRVELADKSVYRGPFVDSPQTLAIFNMKKGIKYTIVLATQCLPLPSYSFTLSLFSHTGLSVATAQHALRHYTELHGSWTRRTCGGNSASPTYLTNPQFALVVPRSSSPLEILLSTANADLQVHVNLVWAGGQRVTAVTARDSVGNSGDYRCACALVSLPSVDSGTYTIVCSTFYPEKLADFTLRIGSNVPCTLTPVPPDAAGRLRARLQPLVFRTHVYKMRAPITVTRLTRVGISVTRAAAATGGTGTPRSHLTIRAKLQSGSGAHSNDLLSTGGGGFQEVGLGLRTGECDVDPQVCRAGSVWVVVEQMGVGEDTLQVELVSDGHVNVGLWEVLDERLSE
ncbi:PALB protein [Xylariaceae sp. FL0255]|nr:PALB protein [Xylariaceae sp. FL0255]